MTTRFLGTLLGCALLGAPFVVVAGAARALVEPLTRTSADALTRLITPLQPAVAEVVAELPVEDELEAAAPLLLAATGQQGKPRAARPAAPAKPKAIFVSEATVLKLSQSAVRPQGSFVAAGPTHPAGLRLSGVAPLGIGVQDGDILIEALGVTPRSPGQVIGAIIEARARQARYLSGTLWRRGQTFPITVEQPYLQPATAGPQLATLTP